MQKTNQRFSFSFIQRSLFVAALLLLAIPAFAQLGEADVDGLHINVPYLFLTGDTKDPDCMVSFEIWGRKRPEDAEVGPVHIIRAVDDLGKNLAQSNGSLPLTLKNVTRATKLMTLQGELELLTPITPDPVFTNFMEHIGETLHHTELVQCGIKVTLLRDEGSPHTDFRIRVEDSQKRFIGVKFQWPDGGDVAAISSKGSMSFGNDVKTFAYRYTEVAAKNANLRIRVDGPKHSATIPFKMTIRPPWVSPKDFEAKVTRIDKYRDKKTNTFCYLTWLSFAGGPLDNATGIKELHITKAESETGKSFEMKTSDPWYYNHFARRGSYSSTAAGTATMLIPLHIQPSDAAAIRILEGEADLFEPSVPNHGIVDFTNIFATPGSIVDNPVLKEHGVGIVYLGRANFRSKTNEWLQSKSWLAINGGIYTAPPEVEDSLLFSMEDSNRKIVSVSGINLSFFDAQGGFVQPETTATSSNLCLYAFRSLSKVAGARIYLATSESLQRVHFKVENVALP